MLIALPPSEGKTTPAEGPPLDLDALSRPALRAPRERVLKALERLVAGRDARALEALGLGPRGLPELERDRALRTAPTAPAREVYSGVLYDRLGLRTLDVAARALAADRVVVLSALFGALGPEDPIPAYRCSAGASLPRIPSLAALWRPPLARALPRCGLVVDLRSGAYRALWRPDGPEVAIVHVVRDGAGGRTAVSHMAKATRGTVARRLLEAGEDPTTAEELVATLDRAGLQAGLGPDERDGSRRVEVVATEA